MLYILNIFCTWIFFVRVFQRYSDTILCAKRTRHCVPRLKTVGNVPEYPWGNVQMFPNFYVVDETPV